MADSDTRENNNLSSPLKSKHFILLLLLALTTLFLRAQDPQQRLFRYFYDAAVTQRVNGDLVGAKDLLTEAYILQPKNAAVAEEFAQVFLAARDSKTALSMAREAVLLDPDNVWYKTFLAELYVKNHHPELAAEVYEDVRRQDPKSEETDYMLSSLYLMTNQPKKALEALNRLEKKTGIDASITSEKFRLYEELGEKRKAEQELERLCKRFPYNTDYQLLLSQCYYMHGKRAKANEIESTIRKNDPSNDKLRELEMARFREAGDTLRSDSLLLCALADTLLSMDKKMEMLTSFLSSSNPQDVNTGEKALSTMAAQFPNNELLHAYYAYFLLMQRRFDEALPELRKIISINPDNEIAWAEYIVAAQEIGDTIGFVTMLDDAILRFPQEPLFKGARAMEYSRAGNYDQALSLYNQALALTDSAETSQLAQLYMYRGDTYALMGDFTNALSNYEKSYALNSEEPLLLNNFAYYLALSGGDLKRAEVMSAKAVSAEPENISFLDTYAWIFHLLGDDVMAELYIQQAYDKGGNLIPEVRMHYDAILNRTNNEKH